MKSILSLICWLCCVSALGQGISALEITGKSGAIVVAATNLTVSGNLIVAGALVNTPVALTDGANIATDASLGNHFRVTLAGNRTLDNPTNPTDGQRCVWELIQDGTGTRTLAYGSAFSFGTDITAAVLTTTASKRDFLTCLYNSTTAKWYVVAFIKGY